MPLVLLMLALKLLLMPWATVVLEALLSL